MINQKKLNVLLALSCFYFQILPSEGPSEASDLIAEVCKRAEVLSAQRGGWFDKEVSELRLKRGALISAGAHASEVMALDKKIKMYRDTEKYILESDPEIRQRYFVKKALTEDPSLFSFDLIRQNQYRIFKYAKLQDMPSRTIIDERLQNLIKLYNGVYDRCHESRPGMISPDDFEYNVKSLITNSLMGFVAFNYKYMEYHNFYKKTGKAFGFLHKYEKYVEIIEAGVEHPEFLDVLDKLSSELLTAETIEFCRKALIALIDKREICANWLESADINRWVEKFAQTPGFSAKLKDILDFYYGRMSQSTDYNRAAAVKSRLFEIFVAERLQDQGHYILAFEKTVCGMGEEGGKLFPHGNSIDIFTEFVGADGTKKKCMVEVKLGAVIRDDSKIQIQSLANWAKSDSAMLYVAHQISPEPYMDIIDLTGIDSESVYQFFSDEVYRRRKEHKSKFEQEIKQRVFQDKKLFIDTIVSLKENFCNKLGFYRPVEYKNNFLDFFAKLDEFKDKTLFIDGVYVPMFDMGSIALNIAKKITTYCCYLHKHQDLPTPAEIIPLGFIKDATFSTRIGIIERFFRGDVTFRDDRILDTLQNFQLIFADLIGKVAFKLVRDYLLSGECTRPGIDGKISIYAWDEYYRLFKGVDGFNEIIIDIAKGQLSGLATLNYARSLLSQGETIQSFNSIELAFDGEVYHVAIVDVTSERDGVVTMHLDANNPKSDSHHTSHVIDYNRSRGVVCKRLDGHDFQRAIESPQVVNMRILNESATDTIYRIGAKLETAGEFQGVFNAIEELLDTEVSDVVFEDKIKDNMKNMFVTDAHLFMKSDRGGRCDDVAFNIAELNSAYYFLKNFNDNFRLLNIFFKGDPRDDSVVAFDYTNAAFRNLFNRLPVKLLPHLLKRKVIDLARDLIRNRDAMKFCKLDTLSDWDWDKYEELFLDVDGFAEIAYNIARYLLNVRFGTDRASGERNDQIRRDIIKLEKASQQVSQGEKIRAFNHVEYCFDGAGKYHCEQFDFVSESFDSELKYHVLGAVSSDSFEKVCSSKGGALVTHYLTPKTESEESLKMRTEALGYLRDMARSRRDIPLLRKIYDMYSKAELPRKLDFIKELYLDESFTPENISGLEVQLLQLLPVDDKFKSDFEFYYKKIVKDLETLGETAGLFEKSKIKFKIAKMFKDALALFLGQPSLDFNKHFESCGFYNLYRFIDTDNFERKFGVLANFMHGAISVQDGEFAHILSNLSPAILPEMVGELSFNAVRRLLRESGGEIGLGSTTITLDSWLDCYERFKDTVGYTELAHSVAKRLVCARSLAKLSDDDKLAISLDVKKLRAALAEEAVVSFNDQDDYFDGRKFWVGETDLKVKQKKSSLAAIYKWQDEGLDDIHGDLIIHHVERPKVYALYRVLAKYGKLENGKHEISPYLNSRAP